MTTSSTYGDECPLCKDHYSIAALGPCDHRICFKCSVRLRVVCGSNECPQCRKASDQVIITRFPGTFMALVRSIGFQKKGFLYTEDDLLRDAEDLLANKCTYCKAGLVFGSFDDLRKHVNKEHRLLYCDFCSENLKLFPSERKAYTSAALVDHRRNGDADDKGYHPHPPCQFCDNQRFFDDDTLYRHLKSDHFSCHLCEASNIFFSDYFELRRHFATKHFLCEEGNCREQRFTNAFSNELDFKGHRAAYHAHLMTKEELRENAKLDMAVFSRLNLSPTTARRQTASEQRVDAGRGAGERGERISKYEKRLREIQKEREALYSDGNESDSATNARGPNPARLTTAEFPALGNDSSPGAGGMPKAISPTSASAAATSAGKSSEGDGGNAAERIALTTRTHNVGKIHRTEEEFPELCSLGSRPISKTSNSAWGGAPPKPATGKQSSAKQRVSSTVNRQIQAPVANPVVAAQPPPKAKEKAGQLEWKPSCSKAPVRYNKAQDVPIVADKKKEKKAAKPDSPPEMDFPPLPNAAPKSSSSKKKSELQAIVNEPQEAPIVDKKKDKKAVKAPKTAPTVLAPEMDFPPLPNAASSRGNGFTMDDYEAQYYNNSSDLQPEPAAEVQSAKSAKSPPPGFAAAAKVTMESPSSVPVPVKTASQPSVQRVEKPNLKSTDDFPDLPLAPPKAEVKRKAPPPGFSIIVPPAATFTSEPVKKSPPPRPPAVFWKVADYEKRNTSLQNAISKNLNANSLEEFRTVSRRFRDGILPAFDFLSKCVDLFPRKQLGFILSEMIVLLPDVRKQQALFEGVSADSLLSTLVPHLLNMCKDCGQIITARDAALHRTQSHNQTAALSANGLPTGDDDPSRIKIDLSNYVLSNAS